MSVPSTYEHRILLFLDFLGFKQHVERSVAEPAHFKRIVRALRTVHEFVGETEGFASRQFTQFSDCVVVSYASGERSAVFDLLSDIALLQVELASQGFLLRGSVVAGDLVHTSDTLFGPAINEAYRRESKLAINPRILVDPGLVQIAKQFPAPHHDGKTEARYVAKFLTKDDDGLDYIDYLTWDAVIEGVGADSDHYPGYLREVARVLKQGFECSDPGVLSKMIWLHERFDAAISHFYEPPRPPGVLAQHEDFYAALGLVPRLQEEVAAARNIIKALAGS